MPYALCPMPMSTSYEISKGYSVTEEGYSSPQ